MGCFSSKKIQNQDSSQSPARTKPLVFFVVGGPGCGKGTLCTRLKSEKGYVHLSTGDLLRAEKAKGGERADHINSFIAEGKLVPVKIVVELVKASMQEHGWEKSSFLIDGFPRNQENIDGWNEVIGQDAEVKGLLYLECSSEVMKQRILKRAETSGRVDDNEATLVKRIGTFEKETVSAVQSYEKSGGHIVRVSAERSPEEVFDDACQKLADLNK